jgi:hypothetical protein
MRKRTLNKLIRDEKGQALILVLVLMVLGGIVLAPMLAYMSTGLKLGKEVYEKRMELFYAADSGIEDGLWQIKYEQLADLFGGSYDPYNYSDSYPYPDPLNIDGKDVDVAIENIWVPKNIPAPDPAEAKLIIEGIGDEPPKLMITGNIPDMSTYQIKIFYYYDNAEDLGGANLSVDTIGIWLPPGFDYDDDYDCSLAYDPDTQPYSDPDVDDYCSGKAVVWDFASVPLTNFPNPGSSSHPMERSFTFRFSGPENENPGAALSWIDTSGVDSIDYTWDARTKVYKITSMATDADTGKQTIVDAYTARSGVYEMGSAMDGDYRAIGNSLLTGASPSHRYRDDPLDESSAEVSVARGNDIPLSAAIDAAYLYWSGWFEEAEEEVIINDNCSDFVAPPVAWSAGSGWSFTGGWDSEFRGRGGTGARTLTMTDSLDLSEYGDEPGETVRISWEQDTNSYVDPSDYLYFAFSGDGGLTWTDPPIEAFHDDDPDSPFSSDIPGEYLTDSFKMKFLLEFNSSNEYAYIDNITISLVSLAADTTCIFKIDGQQVYFDVDGNPAAGAQEIVAGRSQVINNSDYGDPHGYSYSCFKDVTELVQAFADVGNATYTVGSVDATWDARDEWAYAGWSLIIIYSSPETRGHQLYLYDTFLYCDHDTDLDFDRDGQPGGTISGFLVPDQIAGEVDAATITCFVGEGDDWYEGDYYQLNDTSLDDGTSSLNDVWNGRSVGMSAEGVDVDTFHVTWDSGLLEPGDTSAEVDIYTGIDIWNLVYTILSFRSSVTSGGTISYLVRS